VHQSIKEYVFLKLNFKKIVKDKMMTPQAASDTQTLVHFPIPFIDLQSQRDRIAQEVEAATLRVLRTGAYIMGPEVFEFEKQLQDFTGVSHALSCSSGTDALMMGLMAWGIGAGDAVFVPSFTFAATAEVVALVGATPVFVDVLTDTFNMDSESLSEAIDWVRSQKKLTPKAIISVDLFGQPADHFKIQKIADAYGLKVMVDAAQSVGALYQGKHTVSYGDMSGTSFFPAKPLGGYGDGGAIFTNDSELTKLLTSIRVHGHGKDRYDNVRIGINGRLDTLQAAILIEKLKIFPDEIKARQRAAECYTQGLKDYVKTPVVAEGCTSVWAQYTFCVKNRDLVIQKLSEKQVPTMIYYPKPLHRQEAYVHYPCAPKGLPVSERLAHEVLSLPMHAYLPENTQEYIIQTVKEAVR
jgi:dTDP-4-amino-4,6-dideoxygalactose transaminase